MRFFAAIVALSILCFTGCGGGNSDQETGQPPDPLAKALSIAGPEVPIPRGAAPKKLVVNVIERGNGPVIAEGDLAKVRYINVDYRSGRVYEDNWDPSQATHFNFGAGEVLGAWEQGMRGMRVGGRRELIVPASLSYGGVPQIYVLELLATE